MTPIGLREPACRTGTRARDDRRGRRLRAGGLRRGEPSFRVAGHRLGGGLHQSRIRPGRPGDRGLSASHRRGARSRSEHALSTFRRRSRRDALLGTARAGPVSEGDGPERVAVGVCTRDGRRGRHVLPGRRSPRGSRGRQGPVAASRTQVECIVPLADRRPGARRPGVRHDADRPCLVACSARPIALGGAHGRQRPGAEACGSTAPGRARPGARAA